MKTFSVALGSAVLLLLGSVPGGAQGPRGGGRAQPGPQGEMPPVLLLIVLDADRDGELSAEEIAGAEAALKRLDRDGNGRVTAEEMRPRMPAGGWGKPAGRSERPARAGPKSARPSPSRPRPESRPAPAAQQAAASEERTKEVPHGQPSALGLGFLIGKKTEELIPLLRRDNDFLEMMLGPEKVRFIGQLTPPARAMCICESLEGVARSVNILQDAGIDPERVYIAYNPEPRPPGARQCTPREELDDYLGSVKKAHDLVKSYGAPLVMGPGLREMAKREELYAEMARCCEIWMIQTQRLQIDWDSGEAVATERYRQDVKRVVDLLRQGNPKIRVFVQIIPLQATPERKEAFTAERLVSYLRSIEDMVEAAKIYGGNTELIAEMFQRLRSPRGAKP